MLTMRDFLSKQFATFEEVPFGPLDAAAFSQMAMTLADGLIPPLDSRRAVHFRDLMLAEHFDSMFVNLDPERTKFNFLSMAASPRYRDVKIHYYQSVFTDDPPTQFGAMTFTYKQEFTCIAFRGTDRSLTGWKEDCDMSFVVPVPSQTMGLEYVKRIAAKWSLPPALYIVGHSKGGNIAEYAALKCGKEIQNRIRRVYELDAPGFRKGAFTDEEYAPVKDKLYKVVPQDSIVGLLMHSAALLHVAHSDEKGFNAHNAFTWQVNDDLTDFVYLDELDPKAEGHAAAIQVWADELSVDELKELTHALFAAMKASGATDIRPLLDGGLPALKIYLQAAMDSDLKERTALLNAVYKLFRDLSLA